MSYFHTRHTPFVISFCALVLATSLLVRPAFAVKSNKAKPSGATDNSNNGYLGLATVTDDEDEIRVMMVVAGGPAEKAGVRRGDVIRELNSQPVTSNDMVARSMRGPVGSKVKLLLAREDDEGDVNLLTVTITRAAMPGTQAAQAGRPAAGATPKNRTQTNGAQQRGGNHAPATRRPTQPRINQPINNGPGDNVNSVSNLPAFLKPGLRLDCHQSRSLPRNAPA